MTSYLSLKSKVVFPASSRPRKTILAFLFIKPKLSRVDLNQLKIHIENLNKMKNIIPHVSNLELKKKKFLTSKKLTVFIDFYNRK